MLRLIDHILNEPMKIVYLLVWMQLAKYVLDVHLGSLTSPLKRSITDFSAVVHNPPVFCSWKIQFILLWSNCSFVSLPDHRAWYSPAAVWSFLYDPVYSGSVLLLSYPFLDMCPELKFDLCGVSVHGSVYTDGRSSIRCHDRYTQRVYSFFWGFAFSNVTILVTAFTCVFLSQPAYHMSIPHHH